MRDLDLLDEPRAKSPTSLEYKPEPPTQVRVTVRGFRLFLALTLLNTTLLASSVLGPQLFPFLRTNWTQWQADRAQRKAKAQQVQALLSARQQCLVHSFAPGTVLYEEDPGEALRLMRDGGTDFARAMGPPDGSPRGWVPPVAAVPPAYAVTWQQRSPGSMPGWTILFLGERATPGGARYLVSVQFNSRFGFDQRSDNDPATSQSRLTYRQAKTRRLRVTAWPVVPAADFDPQKVNAGVLTREYRLQLPDAFQRPVASRPFTADAERVVPQADYGNVLRIFGGQPDAGDKCRFAIRYLIDGHEGVLLGRLKNDGIELLPRDGDWKFDNGEVLRLDAPPATQPTIYPASPTKD